MSSYLLKSTKSTRPLKLQPIRYNYEISIYNLIVWLFCFQNQELLSDDDKTRILNLCGRSKEFLNPMIKIGQLKELMTKLRGQERVKNNSSRGEETNEKQRQYFIKLCVSLSYIRQEEYERIIKESNIHEICIFCPEQTDINELTKISKSFQKQKKAVYFCSNIKQIIEMASKEVQHFTKASRTFHNSQPLVQENVQKTNKSRYRICACINMKASDENKRAYEMRESAEHEFRKYKTYILDQNTNNTNNGLTSKSKSQNDEKFQEVFGKYQRSIAEYMESLSKALNNKQKIKLNFWRQMVDTYKEQSFFYHFVNNNMRILTEKHDRWQFLAQPISYLYQSIKGLYDHHSSKDPFYQQNSFVYRGGRIKQSQIQNFIKHGLKIQTKTSEEMDRANIIKYLQYVQDLMKKQQSKTVNQAEVANLYIQFYGFLSTTKSLEKAVDNFLYNKIECSNQKPSNPENRQQNQQKNNKKIENQKVSLLKQQEEYGCIFVINVLSAKYSKCPQKLKHGYFKFYSEESTADIQKVVKNYYRINSEEKTKERVYNEAEKKEKEEEILFNVLNTFKVIGITRMQGPEKAVYIIQLQFGPFEEMLFEKSIDKLTKYEKQVRFNYCGVYNKIRNAESFDIADAYEAQNQLEKAENYYQQKLLIQNSRFKSQNYDLSSFELCRRDSKNYILSLSQIYDKRGKMRQAAQALKLVIKYFQFIRREGDSSIYIKHLKKTEQMQKMATEEIQKSVNIFERQLLLKKRRNQLNSNSNREKQRQSNQKNLQGAELDLAEGLFHFQKGDLQKSLEFFNSAEKTTTEFFRNLRSIKEGYLVKDYLLNLFCCCFYKSKINKWTYNYCEFVQKFRPLLLMEHGGEGQAKFDSAFTSAIYLYCDAVAYLGQRIKTLKSPEEFKKLLQRFNSQINLYLKSEEEEIQNIKFQKEPTDQVKRKMQKIYCDIVCLMREKQSLNEQQLNLKGAAILNQINMYEELKGFFLDNQQQKTEQQALKKIFEKFKTEQIARKKNMIERIVGINKERAQQELSKLINQFIDQLLKQNYSQANPKLIKLRNQLADNLSKQKQVSFQKARQQIRIVLQNGCKFEVQHREMAKAHKMNGYLLLKQQKYGEAGDQFAKSIENIITHLNNTAELIPKVQQFSHQLSCARIKNTEHYLNSSYSKEYQRMEEQRLTATNFKHVTHLWYDEIFLQAQLFKCEAHLYQAYELMLEIKQLQKLISENRNEQKISPSVDGWRGIQDRSIQKRMWLMEYVRRVIIDQLENIFKYRENRLKVGKLEVLYPKIIGLYHLNCEPLDSNNIELAFASFAISLQRSDQLQSRNSSISLEMCCEIIYNFGSNPFAYQKIVQLRFQERINDYIQRNNDREHFGWKIYKALYFIQKYKQGRNSLEKLENYLLNAIKHLQLLLQNKQGNFLRRQRNLLNEQLSIMIGDNNQVDKPSYRRKQLLEKHKKQQKQQQRKQYHKSQIMLVSLSQNSKVQELNKQKLQKKGVDVINAQLIHIDNKKQEQKGQLQQVPQSDLPTNLNSESVVTKKKKKKKKRNRRETKKTQLQKIY